MKKEDGHVEVGGASVPSAKRERVELPVSRDASGNWLSLPIEIINGSGQGPTVWLSGVIHGDEIEGVEIIRRVLLQIDPSTLNGQIIAVPIVNIFGFVAESRYLPDRRDLNRSFPGNKSGSMASRLAHLFMTEIVSRSDYGIDLHCGSDDRTNLPQVRANLDDRETRRCAEAVSRAASLNPSRPPACGASWGCWEHLGMWMGALEPKAESLECRKTSWLRAGRSGVLRLRTAMGNQVARGDVLGVIADPCGDEKTAFKVRAKRSGMVIGYTLNPLVNQGDGVVHLADVIVSSSPPGEPSSSTA